MEIQFIFTSKNKNNESVENFLSEHFILCPENIFEIKSFEMDKMPKYKLSLEKVGINARYLKIYFENSEEDFVYMVKILEKIKEIIKKNKKGNFNVTISYDGVSEYLCNLLDAKFNKFERKLKQIIYIILLKAYGSDWVKETISKEKQNQLRKEENVSKLIESGLDKMTYEDYKLYLFDERKISIEDNLILKFQNKKLTELSSFELKSLEEKSNPYTLWDKFFDNDNKEFNLKEEMNYLQDVRNIIFHNKEIKLLEYEKTLEKIENINIKLEKVIEVIEKEIYDDDIIIEILYNDISTSIKMGETMKSLIDFQTKLTKIINLPLQKMKIDILEHQQKISKMTQSFILPRSILNISTDISKKQQRIFDITQSLSRLPNIGLNTSMKTINKSILNNEIIKSKFNAKY
ncbi:hypothetical protein [Oceanivirga salmonicida]|uniref:hypothetical protein n=1 Tax=Oceanivirga salmonicida TaxID=1769291 RepID=UPI00082CAE00|nr:hypothetical protein [Oceanivirga salmonicida]